MKLKSEHEAALQKGEEFSFYPHYDTAACKLYVACSLVLVLTLSSDQMQKSILSFCCCLLSSCVSRSMRIGLKSCWPPSSKHKDSKTRWMDCCEIEIWNLSKLRSLTHIRTGERNSSNKCLTHTTATTLCQFFSSLPRLYKLIQAFISCADYRYILRWWMWKNFETNGFVRLIVRWKLEISWAST